MRLLFTLFLFTLMVVAPYPSLADSDKSTPTFNKGYLQQDVLFKNRMNIYDRSGRKKGYVQQDILFRLDRSGAELKAEAKSYALPIPTYFVFDRPFLIYMKKRGKSQPYFVMWVENAELLQGME